MINCAARDTALAGQWRRGDTNSLGLLGSRFLSPKRNPVFNILQFGTVQLRMLWMEHKLLPQVRR